MKPILIRRVGGGPHEEWYFNGSRLTLCCPSRLSVEFDGVLLEETGHGSRRWALSDSRLAPIDGRGGAWVVERGVLVREGGDAADAWTVEGTSLARIVAPHECWVAGAAVPWPVLAYVAGVLAYGSVSHD